MKKTILICALAVFASGGLAAGLFAQGPPRGEGFGGFGGRGEGILGAGPGSRNVVTGAPYSATETVTSQQTLANGNQITRTHTSMVARDSSGRTSTTETVTPPAASGKAPFTIQTIFDPVGGHRYLLNSSTMIATEESLPKPRGAAAGGRSPAKERERPARPNEATASLGTVVVNGVAASGTQITETVPAGAIGNAQAIQTTRTHGYGVDQHRAGGAERNTVRRACGIYGEAGWTRRRPWPGRSRPWWRLEGRSSRSATTVSSRASLPGSFAPVSGESAFSLIFLKNEQRPQNCLVTCEEN